MRIGSRSARYAVIAVTLLTGGFGAGTATVCAAAERNLAWQPRHVLALYKSSEGMTAQRNHIRMMLEVPLNDLGLLVRYHDISQGLPSDEALDDVAGIITWYTTPELRDPVPYCDWLVHQIEQGRKVIVVGTFGAFVDEETGAPVDWRETERVFTALGVTIDPAFQPGDAPVELVEADPSLMAFERPIDPSELRHYERITASYPNSRVFLTVRLRGVPQSDSHLILTTPKGGLLVDYGYVEDPVTGLRIWHLNPWRFLEAALGIEGTPRLDVSVLNGRRLWFMHIDGDGFSTPSQAQRGLTCAQVMERQILDRYRLPVTVSVITAEVDPQAIGRPSTVRVAKEIFARPLAEPASHSFAHPHDWQRGLVDLRVPGYRFDLTRELEDSLTYVTQQLVPTGEPVQLFLASGMCNLPADRVARLAAHGVRVLNSGDHTQFDHDVPTISGVTPMMTDANGAVQYSHRAANDFVMTDGLKHPNGYQNILETFERTAQPRPIVPINVYVHWYSAQAMDSLVALRRVMEWSAHRPIAPVWASQYLDIVDGFRAARVAREGPGVWLVESNGRCRTVRFDPPMHSHYADLTQSVGVLGSSRIGESLYVFLDEGSWHRIVLTDEVPQGVRVTEANCFVHGLQADEDGALQLDAESPAVGEIELAGVSVGQVYRIVVRDDRARSPRSISIVRADSGGLLHINEPLRGRRLVEVSRTGAWSWWRAQTAKALLPLTVVALVGLWLGAHVRRRREPS